MKRLLFALIVILTACVPGSSFNPISTRPNSGLSVKAGSSLSIKVFTGTTPNLSLSPAALYRRVKNDVDFSGSDNTWADVDAASLGSSSLPQGWNLSLNNDEIELIASSSSSVGFDTIQTFTRVTFGSYRVGAQLSVPGDTAAGTYNVQAQVNLRGASPVAINWTVTVTR